MLGEPRAIRPETHRAGTRCYACRHGCRRRCRVKAACLQRHCARAKAPPVPVSVRRPPGAQRAWPRCLALRWARTQANSFDYAANDYGLVLPRRPTRSCPMPSCSLNCWPSANLLEDLRESLNLAELARRQFREIARVSGLLVPHGCRAARRCSLRQLQASSGLLYDVLRRFDPAHLLLEQAEREVAQRPTRTGPARHHARGLCIANAGLAAAAQPSPRCRFRSGPNAAAASSAPKTGKPACSAPPATGAPPWRG